MCSTGRFTRILSALTGIVEGVGVGVSEGEMLQARLGALWKRVDRDDLDPARALEMARGIVNEAGVPSHERDAWLAPFESLV